MTGHQDRTRKAALLVGALLLVLVSWGAIVVLTHQSGDSDRRSDCWAHPDNLGKRHCATGLDAR